MLHIIGLGLNDEFDITLKGLKTIQNCQHVFLEAYTSILNIDKASLEKLYNVSIKVADREMVESEAETILNLAKNQDVAFLVVGDPFGATTHNDLVLRAEEGKIKVNIIHNASIINACGCCGLSLYSFGCVVSIPWFTKTWTPDSWLDRILINRSNGFHTLCLLDIKVKEPTLDSILKKRKEYEPPRYMSIRIALTQCLQIIRQRTDIMDLNENSMVVGLARVGSSAQHICYGRMNVLIEHDFGSPLHSLIIPGRLQDMEETMLSRYLVSLESTDTDQSIIPVKANHTI